MATVAQVAQAALREIIVQGDSSPLEPEEYQDFMFAMNNYMTMLDAQGVALGYTLVNNLADPVTIPNGALVGLIKNMALQMAPQFGRTAPPELVIQAAAAENVMRMIGSPQLFTYLPSTLPIGSGNYDEQFGDSRFFYPGAPADILGETTGSIGLETGTDE